MRILKLAIWFIFVFVVGLTGTVVIVLIAGSLIDNQSKIRIPSGPFAYTDAWDRGFASAEGTFTIDNDKQAFPIQVTKIQCYRDEKSCTTARAEIGYGNMLHVNLSNHPISLWNTTTIQFLEDAVCVQYIYSIDRATGRVVGSRSKKTNVTGCDVFENKPMTLSLVNGFDVWLKVNHEASNRVTPFMWAGIGAWWVIVLLYGWSRRPKPTVTKEVAYDDRRSSYS